MDLLLTVALIYLAYRGYSWYTATQERIREGSAPPTINERDFERPDYEDEGEYTDYEEVP